MIFDETLDLKIQDNFFTEDEFNRIVNVIRKCPMEPEKNDVGHYGFRINFINNGEYDWVLEKIKNTFHPNTIYMKHTFSAHIRHNKDKTRHHTDDASHNCMVYLEGKELFHNGTAFWDNQGKLTATVAFKPNRAIFFNGEDNSHSDMQAMGESSQRLTLNVFMGDPKKIDAKKNYD